MPQRPSGRLDDAASRVRVPKAAERVADIVRRQIITGTLLEGDGLASESALTTEFDVSRPTLREAFRILESEGLITVRRGAHGGARVQLPSVDVASRYAGFVLQHRGTTLADVLNARAIVEPPAAGVLASQPDRGSIADQLQAKLDELPREDPTRFNEFNTLVVELTGNETLVLLTAMLEHISRAAAIRFAHTVPSETSQRLNAKARRARAVLIQLIRDGNVSEAEQLWWRHITESGRVLTDAANGMVLDLFA
jgi:DNA-binding FadR family transcriptional regulator